MSPTRQKTNHWWKPQVESQLYDHSNNTHETGQELRQGSKRGKLHSSSESEISFMRIYALNEVVKSLQPRVYVFGKEMTIGVWLCRISGMDAPPCGEGGVPAQPHTVGRGGSPPRKNDQNRGEVAGQNKGLYLNFLQKRKLMMEQYHNTEHEWTMPNPAYQ